VVELRDGLTLADPAHRWRCSYAVILKATSLDIDPTSIALQRLEHFLAWMFEDPSWQVPPSYSVRCSFPSARRVAVS
jgi:hypothetical protein